MFLIKLFCLYTTYMLLYICMCFSFYTWPVFLIISFFLYFWLSPINLLYWLELTEKISCHHYLTNKGSWSRIFLGLFLFPFIFSPKGKKQQKKIHYFGLDAHVLKVIFVSFFSFLAFPDAIEVRFVTDLLSDLLSVSTDFTDVTPDEGEEGEEDGVE